MDSNKIWKFALLILFAAIVGIQMRFYMIKLQKCNDPTLPTLPACDQLLEGYQKAVDTHLQTILALMVGGGAIASAAGAISGGKKQENVPIKDEPELEPIFEPESEPEPLLVFEPEPEPEPVPEPPKVVKPRQYKRTTPIDKPK